MAKTLNSKLTIAAITGYVDTLDLSSRENRQDFSKVLSLLTGVGASQADRIFHDTRTLAASGTEDLDVAAGGGLLDGLGDALALAKIKALIVYARAENTNTVDVSRPAANGVPIFAAASDKLSVRPGGAFVLIAPDLAGIPVTAATADLITFTNGGAGTPVTYDVIIIGTSA